MTRRRDISPSTHVALRARAERELSVHAEGLEAIGRQVDAAAQHRLDKVIAINSRRPRAGRLRS